MFLLKLAEFNRHRKRITTIYSRCIYDRQKKESIINPLPDYTRKRKSWKRRYHILESSPYISTLALLSKSFLLDTRFFFSREICWVVRRETFRSWEIGTEKTRRAIGRKSPGARGKNKRAEERSEALADKRGEARESLHQKLNKSLLGALGEDGAGVRGGGGEIVKKGRRRSTCREMPANVWDASANGRGNKERRPR